MAVSRARLLRAAGRIILYGVMLLAVFALWKPDAPPFIYVAF